MKRAPSYLMLKLFIKIRIRLNIENRGEFINSVGLPTRQSKASEHTYSPVAGIAAEGTTFTFNMMSGFNDNL
ncbi:hypothetical protein KEM54_003763 [Ascosphaera aggregata]|nr:hypothetical protein KEM54_003763 [Ascosphaera aggregata]